MLTNVKLRVHLNLIKNIWIKIQNINFVFTSRIVRQLLYFNKRVRFVNGNRNKAHTHIDYKINNTFFSSSSDTSLGFQA